MSIAIDPIQINWTQSLAANVGEDFAAALASRIRAEDEILAEGYYRDVGDNDDEYGS